ncbi:hypothetical protein PFX98_22245 [Paucibacter sediminis]|uniref:Uncharacterized protein n=1 Tax=Paucibacter sediminis TaxID=3019553 RepID=A0AA95NAC4_9BURK|nr:hypothetical protein [Paucibacter sp. S2-9]WIT11580.1 hypothetical protein PFX98_22245 [Paucibacter sp. S2-9]
MRNPTLTRVTLNTVEHCRIAAKQFVLAYRLGSQRVIGKLDGALANTAVSPRITGLTGWVAKGVEQVAERSTQAIDFGAHTAAAQVSKAAKLVKGVDNEMLANGLQTASRLSLPTALALLAVAGKAAAGADSLVKAVQPTKKLAKRAVRPTRPAVKAAVKRAARKPAVKAVKAMKPVVAAKAKPVRVAAKKVAVTTEPAAA